MKDFFSGNFIIIGRLTENGFIASRRGDFWCPVHVLAGRRALRRSYFQVNIWRQLCIFSLVDQQRIESNWTCLKWPDRNRIVLLSDNLSGDLSVDLSVDWSENWRIINVQIVFSLCFALSVLSMIFNGICLFCFFLNRIILFYFILGLFLRTALVTFINFQICLICHFFYGQSVLILYFSLV